MERSELCRIPVKKALRASLAVSAIAAIALFVPKIRDSGTLSVSSEPDGSAAARTIDKLSPQEQFAALLDFMPPKGNEIKLPQLCEDPDLVAPLHPEWDYHPEPTQKAEEQPLVLKGAMLVDVCKS